MLMKAISPLSSLTATAVLVLFVTAEAAAAGRALDGDADGVPDSQDVCPYSLRGMVVGPDGCASPGDEDRDGVQDGADDCPRSPAAAFVDAQGCALDEDVDGIADGVDRCPNTPFAIAADARGCGKGQREVALPPPRPRPNAPAPAIVFATPPSLPPEQLPRILVSPTRAVRPAGPHTANPGTAARQMPDLTLYFDGGDAKLNAESVRAIRDTAELLREDLARNAQAVLMLSGHADTKSDGMGGATRLAAQRVSVVRQALIEAGLPANRLSVRAAGVSEPRYAGAELARNCRVELRMQGRRTVSEGQIAQVGPAAPQTLKPLAPAVPTVLVAKHRPPTAAAVAVAASVAFAPYSAHLDERAVAELNGFAAKFAARLQQHPQTQVVISGGVDGAETGEPAQRLGQSRAVSVRSYLKTLGLPADRIAIGSDTVSHAGDGSGRRADLRVIAPAP